MGDRWEAVGGYTPRHDQKSAEVIDKQRVVIRPLRKRVRNPLKRKDLNIRMTEMDEAMGEKIEIGDWQTRGTIALNYIACQVLIWISFEWDGKVLKRHRVEGLMSEIQGMGIQRGADLT